MNPFCPPPLPRLLLITEPVGSDGKDELLKRLEHALRGGACHILVRLPGWSSRELHAMAVTMRTLVTPPSHLLIHDRVDIALAVNADGVHLPATGLPTRVARRILGNTPLLGRSCHTVTEACQALADGANHVTLSPLFATCSHPGAIPLGLPHFTQMVQAIPGPVIALGGITPDNIAQAMTTGAAGVATIRGVLQTQDPAHATRLMLNILTAPATR
ncbi:MAG: thiamine phosphate synthase [Magnetococcus sp. DMHC-1]|nr:thiamine phosphate synthase [Magnetococcales bacterium]